MLRANCLWAVTLLNLHVDSHNRIGGNVLKMKEKPALQIPQPLLPMFDFVSGVHN